MAGNVTITNVTLVKETPTIVAMSSATAVDAYKTSTGIVFAYVEDNCTITIASGFDTAGFDNQASERILISTTSGLNDGLYTIRGRSDTVITLSAGDVLADETAAAAGTVVLYTVAVYVITPTKHMSKLLIKIYEGAGGSGMIMSVLPGTHWAGKNTTYVDMQNTLTLSDTSYVFIETAPYVQADGTILVMLRPVAAGKLLASHAPTVGFIQLP